MMVLSNFIFFKDRSSKNMDDNINNNTMTSDIPLDCNPNKLIANIQQQSSTSLSSSWGSGDFQSNRYYGDSLIQFKRACTNRYSYSTAD